MKMHQVKMIAAVMAATVAVGDDRLAEDFERLTRDPWAETRAAAVNRARPLVYNTDGCDMLYWPSNLPVSVENFTARRLDYVAGTHISTVSYCPQSAGFGHFTCRKAGEPLTGTVPNPGTYNSASKFFALGTDALQMASECCRTNNLEVFVSIRVNDQHDAVSRPGKLSALYPPFKVNHPDWLMGALDPQSPRRKELYKGYAGWSCVNFAEAGVREHMKKFVRDLVTNYDVDGIEYDFNRHFMLFRSVATGGVATVEEVAAMTQFMRELKAITDEVGKRNGRPSVMAMRMPDSKAYDLAVGADIETWFREKLVDIWVGGGYFLLNPLKDSVALAHKYGVKFYWSLDETRIPGVVARKKLPIIPGRMTVPFYTGRFAAAREAGCDGVYLFNIENEFLREVASVDPTNTAGEEKIYFATERGAGGYTPNHWLKDGDRFNRLPTIDPGKPMAMKGGETYKFEMMLGDDFGGTKPPQVTVLALTNLKTEEKIGFVCNGKPFEAMTAKDGLFSYDMPIGSLIKGVNSFAVTIPTTIEEGATFNDFAITVSP